MRFAVRRAAVAVALIMSAFACDNPDQTSLDDVIARHVEALGGAPALDAIKSVRIRATIVEPTFEVTGDYRASVDGMMRVDIFAGAERVFSEGVDADGPWQQNGAGAPMTGMSAEGEAALRHGIEFNLFGLHRFAERGHSLALEGEKMIGDVRYHVVKAKLADGFETFFYINAETALIERRRDRRALHPDVDAEERPIETVYGDFAVDCGVLGARASKQFDLVSGAVVQTTQVIERACNLPADQLSIARDIP